MFSLYWHGEEIETEIETRKEAEFLQREYALAFNGIVTIKQIAKRRTKE